MRGRELEARKGADVDLEALVEFVRARLDEDALYAKLASWTGGTTTPQVTWHNRSIVRSLHSDQEIYTDDGGMVTVVPYWAGPHVARWDPQRVLDEVNAKGLMLERFAAAFRVSGTLGDAAVLRLLAAPYSGHEDWREEWQW